MACEFKYAADGVADDGAAEVADVHLFGDVGARKVNRHLKFQSRGERKFAKNGAQRKRKKKKRAD